MRTTDKGFVDIDILFVTPKDNLDFCCQISSTYYDFDEIPTATIYDKTGKKRLGIIRMEHKPTSVIDFEECDESIPPQIVKAFYEFISQDDNYDDFMSNWDSFPDLYEEEIEVEA
ncbi:hypothetical protein [Succinivibrio dextrinosolvens]|uniref:hypothetical protein n=1 Tax=Succinivibrio dextrinosolvens TaxID=83771 RepID=UPI00241FA3DF|nr:hypothetical protein [Succinivibrio dextrinosolvens]MBE6422795.1 hypothetical protein [Succinivibrio dextrinosolvens]